VDITTGLPTSAPIGSDFNGAVGAPFGANALAVSGGKIAVGGDYTSLGGVARNRAAALSISGGGALPWSPIFQAPVTSLALGPSAIYVGGTYTNFNGTNVPGLVALDPVTGNQLAFTFRGSNSFSSVTINSLALKAGTGLFVGGAFTTVAGTARRLLALVDPVTGALIPDFDAKLGGGFNGVVAMVLNGTNLYTAGDFTSVNSVSLARLVDLSTVDGTAISSWQPAPNQAVAVLSASSDTLYVGGAFSQINGITLKNFAAFSLADQSLVPIDASLPTFAGGVTGIGATTTVIYLGGSFSAAGGELRTNVASISPLDGSAFGWGPPMDQGPAVITVTDGYAYMGGPFRFVGSETVGFFAPFSRAPQFQSVTLSDPSTLQTVLTTGDRTDVVIQWTSDLGTGIWTSVATNSPGFPWSYPAPISGSRGFLRAIAR
jgi:hypothetical protein